jgi:hypothetical protein
LELGPPSSREKGQEKMEANVMRNEQFYGIIEFIRSIVRIAPTKEQALEEIERAARERRSFSFFRQVCL